MIKLIIKEIDNYNYILEHNNIKYNLTIELINTDITLSKGDIIYIEKSVIQEKIPLIFGPINGKYSKNELNEKEFITILKNNNKIYLQRYYG